jgi:hypothetical protein
MDLLGMLQSQLTPDIINELSNQVGATPQQTQVAAQGAISALLTGLANNTKTEQGANDLHSALDIHDGSILNNLMDLVTGNAQTANPNVLNGDGILSHILGNNQDNAAQVISHMSGVPQSGVSDILSKLAPMVMGLLGQVKGSNGLDAGGLASILMGAVNGQGSNPIMQVLSHVLGGGGGLGNILGSVLGGGNAQQGQPAQQQSPQGGSVLDDLIRKVGGSILGNILK